MMLRRPTGWLQDKPDPRDYRASLKIASEAFYAAAQQGGALRQDTPTMLRFRALRLYQGSHNACFAFALARAMHLFLIARGQNVQEPSPAFLYWIARSEEFAGTPPDQVPPLEDRGVYPRLGMTAVQSLGFVEWSVWRYPERVHVRPHAGIYLRAIQTDLSYFRVFEVGEARCALIVAALKVLHPVIIGLRVGPTFEAWNTLATLERRDFADADAGHMVTVLEMDTEGRRCRIDNWWPQWGDSAGTGWLSYDVLGDPRIVVDAYVVSAVLGAAPTPQEVSA